MACKSSGKKKAQQRKAEAKSQAARNLASK